MRSHLAAVSAALVLAAAGSADAAIVIGAFSGVITSGEARGNFGYAFDVGTDLVGKAITGTFRYDTDQLGPNCPISKSYFGCFLGAGMTFTETVNGVTEVFPGSPLAGGDGLPFNIGRSGLLLGNLAKATVNLQTASMIGSPATVYNHREAGLAVLLAPGSIPDPSNPSLSYAGAAEGSERPYLYDGLSFSDNRTILDQITAGVVTQQTSFAFRIDSFSAGAAPEPAVWGLMIVGVGMMGHRLRRRLPAHAARPL